MELESKQAELAKLQNNINQELLKLKSLVSERQEAKGQVVHAKDELERVQGALVEANDALTKSKSEAQALEKECSNLQTVRDVLVSQQGDQRKYLNDLKNQEHDLKISLETSKNELEQVRKQVREAKTEGRQAQMDLEAINEVLESGKQEVARLNSLIVALHSEQESALKAIETTKQEFEAQCQAKTLALDKREGDLSRRERWLHEERNSIKELVKQGIDSFNEYQKQ